jgi:signal transduction histidine kinase
MDSLPKNSLTKFALWTDNKPRWWIGLSIPFAAVMTLITAVTPGLPTREIYKSYYVHMLPRVQTVDFNMLFYTLPAALSNAMAGHHVEEIKNNPSQYRQISQNIQNILDSNYGVFDLLVTHENIKLSNLGNDKDKNILYQTKNQGLTDVLDRGYIVHSDLILYPQPACSTVSYPDPKAERPEVNRECQAKIEKAIAEGRAKVLGRVHYVKGKTPTFGKIAQNFIKDPFSEDSGYHFIRHYLGFTFIAFFLLYWFVRFVLKHTATQYKLNQALKESLENEVVALHFEKQLIEFEYQITQESAQRELLEKQNQVLEEQNRRIEAENRLLRLMEFDQVFRQQIDAIFTSEVGNTLQRINTEYLAMFRRLETDVQNITHDIRKAPLLCSLDVIKEALERIRRTDSRDEKIDLLIEIITRIDNSIQIINQVINNLDEMISLEKRTYKLSDLLDEFERNLPNNVRDIPLSFIRENCDYCININRWHFRSILKNILYNSRKELIRLRIRRVRIGESFQPQIKVYCSVIKDKNEAQIVIEDNGGGIPEQYLDKLYQTPERLNQSNGRASGNGSMIVFAYLSFHNGKAKVENLKENDNDNARTIGARVTISFPIVECPTECLNEKRCSQLNEGGTHHGSLSSC